MPAALRIGFTVLVVGAAAATLTLSPPVTGQQAGLVPVAVADTDSVRQWDATVEVSRRAGELRLLRERSDTMVPGHRFERFDQYHSGIRVFGGGLTRQTAAGSARSIFGTLYRDLPNDASPTLGEDAARTRIADLAGVAADDLGPTLRPELVWLPLDQGGYALTYRMRVVSRGGVTMHFVDARTGASRLAYSDLQTQAAVGAGLGVLGDRKKVSVLREGTLFRATDDLRPPEITTYDMKGNLTRTIHALNDISILVSNDRATDADNSWVDAAAVDAHAHTGLVYDYYFKRFGRRGLDDNNIPIRSLVHTVDRADIESESLSVIGMFYMNAAYFGDGVMMYGEGLPDTFVDGEGRHWNFTAGALDIVAHELTHGVTDYSSRLVYRNESGALNEAFSDILGVSAEFFFQPKGSGPRQADYLMGEDVITGGLRSLSNPGRFGDPDHYSKRFRGARDNGGVHTNSMIGGHAFFLAIEGGVNRTSGQRVTGVGAANRVQIEQAFYRAFVDLLPPNATYALARAATLASAGDLFGSTSAPARAIAAAWSAVGVE